MSDSDDGFPAFCTALGDEPAPCRRSSFDPSKHTLEDDEDEQPPGQSQSRAAVGTLGLGGHNRAPPLETGSHGSPYEQHANNAMLYTPHGPSGSGGQQTSRASRPEMNATRQGKHSRETASKKESHADQAHSYNQAIGTGALAGVCCADCNLACSLSLTRNEMFQCHEYSYGTCSFVSDATLKVTPTFHAEPPSCLAHPRVCAHRLRSVSQLYPTEKRRCLMVR